MRVQVTSEILHHQNCPPAFPHALTALAAKEDFTVPSMRSMLSMHAIPLTGDS
jgi:hypothetical protein